MKAAGPDTVEVILLTGLKKPLGYRVPEPMSADIAVGSLVRVPILRRNELGIVQSLQAPGDFPRNKLKYIYGLVHPFPVLTPDLMELARWMQGYYAASAEVTLTAMIPAAVRRGMREKRLLFLRSARKLEKEELDSLRRRAPKQAELYEFLLQQIKPISRATVIKRLGVAPASCAALIAKGVVAESSMTVQRVAYEDDLSAAEHVSPGVFDLNPEQIEAATDIVKSLDAGKFRVHLLHGVTGSGKTEVYIQAVKRVLALGGGVIFLVPEVALTPQTVGRLRFRLEEAGGERTVVWHSHLSEGERLDAWHALATGEARVVVGARSGIFAPIRNLRLIIVDEEHEPAYKQEETPRYHGRDVAVYRARLCGGVCVLGSATPSLESLYNVELGKYRLNRLPRRVDDRQLPLIHVVDMKREIFSRKGLVMLSRLLVDKLRERHEAGEQSIIFLNRRGYSTSMLCPDCGEVEMCAHCSITLTYHRTDQTLRCHLCGSQRRAPRRCPKCGSDKIRWRGFGTQRIEETIGKVLPGAKVVRIDSDAMQKKNLFRQILGDFRLGRIDVLVGTQMIAKGLDFPNVTLVGLVDSDLSLHIPDFRASERTFQLLVQVAGRSGRGERAGEVVVQSFLPHSAPIQFARRQDFDGFNKEELEQRREYNYPPFRHLIHHLFRGKNPDKVLFYAEQWARLAESRLPKSVEIRGPVPAPFEKIKDDYRFQIWYFVKNVSKTIPLLVSLRQEFKMDKAVIDVFDVDPVHLT